MNLPVRRTLQTLDDTRALAQDLAKEFGLGITYALVGELGAGKTTFTQLLAQALGVSEDEEVVSPTYTLMNVHPLDKGALCHIDFYRLEDEDALQTLGIAENIGAPKVVAVVEWADKFPDLIPADAVWVRFSWEAQYREVVVQRQTPR